MGKFILMLLISSIFSLNADAQDTVSAKMEVRYLVSYVTDTVKNIVLEDTFCLRFNEEKSLFYESDTFMKDSLRYNDIAKWSDMMSKILTISYPRNKGEADYYVLTDYVQGTYIYQDRIAGGTYRYSDSLPSFDWQILPEYKDINGTKCQKAVGRYMGRKYEAWYATNLPVKACPWKFYGLPGLIVEVYDSKHLYSFKMVDMQPCFGKIALFPSRHFKTTKDKFLKEQSLYLADPVYYEENYALTKIHFGNSSQGFVTKMKNNSRHQPMELLK